MIAKLLRNFVIALLLHAGTTLAFGDRDEPPAATIAAAPQACLLPVAAAPEHVAPLSTHTDTGARS